MSMSMSMSLSMSMSCGRALLWTERDARVGKEIRHTGMCGKLQAGDDLRSHAWGRI